MLRMALVDRMAIVVLLVRAPLPAMRLAFFQLAFDRSNTSKQTYKAPYLNNTDRNIKGKDSMRF